MVKYAYLNSKYVNFKDAKVMYVVHKGLSYGKLFEKELYYSDDENSSFHKNNILHLDYSNHISSNSNLKWYSIGTTLKNQSLLQEISRVEK